MTPDEILLASLFVAVLIALLTLVLVIYTPFGKDVRNLAVRFGRAGAQLVSGWVQGLAKSVRRRRLYWVFLLMSSAFWTVMVFAGSQNPTLDLRGVNSIAPDLALLLTLIGLWIAYAGGEDGTKASPTIPSEQIAAAPTLNAPPSTDSVKHQLAAAASAVLHYANPEGYTDWDHVEPINALIIQLYAQAGDDLTTFSIPLRWNESGYVSNMKLLPRIEALLDSLRPRPGVG